VPWWRHGLVFAGICVLLRCWRWITRSS